MKKFEQIKNDISTNTERFNSYQEEIEHKKLELEATSLEVENFRNAKLNKELLELESAKEREKLCKQITTLNSLKTALQMKQNMTVLDNKENTPAGQI